jgi:hypothetical protein
MGMGAGSPVLEGDHGLQVAGVLALLQPARVRHAVRAGQVRVCHQHNEQL